MTDYSSGTGKHYDNLGHTGYLGNKDSQYVFAGINNAYRNACPATQLTKDIGGTHVLIPHLPDIAAL